MTRPLHRRHGSLGRWPGVLAITPLLAIAALLMVAAATPAHADSPIDEAARDAMCTGRTGIPLRDCREFCRTWPANRGCLLLRNWGRHAGDCWITAAKKKMTLDAACKATGFSAAEVPKLRLWLDSTMMLPHDWPQTGQFHSLAKTRAASGFKRIDQGAALQRQGKTALAAASFREARKLLEEAVGPTDRSVCLAVSNLATSLQAAGKAKDAVKAASEAIALCKISVGMLPNERVANGYWTRGLAYRDLGKPRQQLESMRAAVAEADKCLTKDHAKTAEIRLSLADALRDSALYKESLETAKEALEVLRALTGPLAPKSLVGLQKVASAASASGDHAAALENGRAALAAYRSKRSPTHADVLTARHNLATYYAAAGEVALARREFETVMGALEKIDGPEFTRLATTEHLYGRLLRDSGQLINALKLFKRSYDRRAKAHGLLAPPTILVAHDLEKIRAQVTGDYKPLLKVRTYLYQELRKKHGPRHQQSVRALINYAQTLADTGNRKQALHLSSQALPVLRELGDHSSALLQRLQMAGWSLDLGQNAQAKTYLNGVGAQLDKGLITDRFNSLHARIRLSHSWHRLGVMKKARREGREILSLARQTLSDGIDLAPHDSALLQTVIGLEMARSQQLITVWEDANAAADAVLFWQGLSARSEAVWREHRGTATRSRADLDRAVAPNRKAVCANLKRDKSSLVAYVRWSKPRKVRSDQTHDGHMSAITLSPRGCKAHVTHLGTSKVIDAAVATWRGHLGAISSCLTKRRRATFCRRQLQAMKTAGTALRALVWDPVALHLPRAGRVWIAPDGGVAKVPLAALADSKGRYLVEDRELALLPFPSAATTRIQRKFAKSGAFVAGDLDYQNVLASSTQALDSWQLCKRGNCETLGSEKADFSLRSTDVAAVRGAAVCGRQAAWRRLPPTEAVTVAAQLSAAFAGEVLLASQQSAYEPAVRNALVGRRVVHLATHGFFSPAKKCMDIDGAREEAMKQSSTSGSAQAALSKTLFDPLRLSAVVLSGANQLAGADPLADGVLSGREVARMDLRTTELVVLSACETGLGEQQAGEGSLGLARAFLLAGVGHVVTSLWQVPSKETAQLFGRFYQHAYSGKALHPATALRRARLDLIADLKARGLPANAYFWAAFQPLSAGL